MSRYFHIVIFVLLAFAGTTAFAQEQSSVPRRTAEERAMKQTEMLAIILAGGRGSRLKALTSKIAKPAVSFGGRYRIILLRNYYNVKRIDS